MANTKESKYRNYWWLVDYRCEDDWQAEDAEENGREEFRKQWFEFVEENIGNWDYQ